MNRSNTTLYLDSTRITTPLTLRHPRTGDRFHPFGMKGSKLVSDFLTDCKLNRFEKEKQWLLCEGDEILWVVGKRSSEKYRIHEFPESLLMLHWE